ncbi:hypothetical protein N9A81_00715 [Synechococcus sp. AH-707-M23]|nr:hypothetical protein [Synechococcus sp. AH-707-M23]
MNNFFFIGFTDKIVNHFNHLHTSSDTYSWIGFHESVICTDDQILYNRKPFVDPNSFEYSCFLSNFSFVEIQSAKTISSKVLESLSSDQRIALTDLFSRIGVTDVRRSNYYLHQVSVAIQLILLRYHPSVFLFRESPQTAFEYLLAIVANSLNIPAYAFDPIEFFRCFRLYDLSLPKSYDLTSITFDSFSISEKSISAGVQKVLHREVLFNDNSDQIHIYQDIYNRSIFIFIFWSIFYFLRNSTITTFRLGKHLLYTFLSLFRPYRIDSSLFTSYSSSLYYRRFHESIFHISLSFLLVKTIFLDFIYSMLCIFDYRIVRSSLGSKFSLFVPNYQPERTTNPDDYRFFDHRLNVFLNSRPSQSLIFKEHPLTFKRDFNIYFRCPLHRSLRYYLEVKTNKQNPVLFVPYWIDTFDLAVTNCDFVFSSNSSLMLELSLTCSSVTKFLTGDYYSADIVNGNTDCAASARHLQDKLSKSVVISDPLDPQFIIPFLVEFTCKFSHESKN